MRYAICYVSTANQDISSSEIVEILQQTESRNNQHGINGMLVYSEGTFLEVIEGEKKMIKELFESISVDKRHKNLIVIFEKDINKKLFLDEESAFICENMLYRKMDEEHFLEYIKDLDESTKNVVKNMLTNMGKASQFNAGN